MLSVLFITAHGTHDTFSHSEFIYLVGYYNLFMIKEYVLVPISERKIIAQKIRTGIFITSFLSYRVRGSHGFELAKLRK